MLLKLTLVPNREDQPRYTRILKYVRQGNRVLPYLVTREHVQLLSWRDLYGGHTATIWQRRAA